MRLALVFLGLSAALTAVLIFQAVKQDYNLRNLKTSMIENTVQVKRKEQKIVEFKTKSQDMKKELVSINTEVDELKKKKTERETAAQVFSKALQTCNQEKADTEKKTSVTGEAIVKLKADHTAAKQNAEIDIQQLKKQILERDQAICAFADTTKEEAKKLCAIYEAPQ